MIGHCFNPECNEELRYLREGSVYQRETGIGQEFHSEFFWLCPLCSSALKLASDDNGEPVTCAMRLEERGRPKALSNQESIQGSVAGMCRCRIATRGCY